MKASRWHHHRIPFAGNGWECDLLPEEPTAAQLPEPGVPPLGGMSMTVTRTGREEPC